MLGAEGPRGALPPAPPTSRLGSEGAAPGGGGGTSPVMATLALREPAPVCGRARVPCPLWGIAYELQGMRAAG